MNSRISSEESTKLRMNRMRSGYDFNIKTNREDVARSAEDETREMEVFAICNNTHTEVAFKTREN